MFNRNHIAIALAATLGAIASTAEIASAGSLHNGWNYSIDSFEDGSDLGVYGANSKYEFYGLAFAEIEDTVYVGINSNLTLGGASFNWAADKHIGYGDMFFNFSGNNAQTTNANSDFYGIRFATNSDSLAPELGLYSNVMGRNVAKANSGFKHLKHHRNWANNAGGSASLGDISDMSNGGEAKNYFGNGFNKKYKLPNSIASGTKIGDINLLDGTALSAAGLDFGHFGASGNYTFGFSFDRDLLPAGEFIAHLFAECINDGIVLKGETEEYEPTSASVPEPATAFALGLVAVVGGASKLRRRNA